MSTDNNNNIDYYKYSKTTQNEIKPYTGLQLSRYKNDVATKISGPVSMYLLRPTKEGYQLPVSIPIMMLFGDIHTNRENECIDCETDPTCYEIDTRFLSKLNEMFSYKYPIDFYTEFFGVPHDVDFLKKSRLYSFTSIHSLITKCYGPNKNKLCFYPNIRFHYADVRHKSNSIEYELNMVYNCTNMISLGKFTKKWLESVTNVDNIKSVISDLIELFENNNIDTLRYAIFDYIINKKNSIIRKEFERLEILNDINIWKDYFGKIYLPTEQIKDITLMTDALKFIKSNLLNDSISIQENILILDKFLLYTNARFLDIYFLMRVFKTLKPKAGTNSNRSGLSIGYFGASHIYNIIRFLLEINLYEIVYGNPLKSGSSAPMSRCITIDLPVSLFELRSQHMKILEKNEEISYEKPVIKRDQANNEPSKPNLKRNQDYAELIKPVLIRTQDYPSNFKLNIPINSTVPSSASASSTSGGRSKQKKTRRYHKISIRVKKTRHNQKKTSRRK